MIKKKQKSFDVMEEEMMEIENVHGGTPSIKGGVISIYLGCNKNIVSWLWFCKRTLAISISRTINHAIISSIFLSAFTSKYLYGRHPNYK